MCFLEHQQQKFNVAFASCVTLNAIFFVAYSGKFTPLAASHFCKKNGIPLHPRLGSAVVFIASPTDVLSNKFFNKSIMVYLAVLIKAVLFI